MCHGRAEFEQEDSIQNLARSDAGGSAGTTQRASDVRQGICRRRFNCKGDDRLAEPARLGHPLLQCSGIDSLRSLQQRIRAFETGGTVERNANAVLGKQRSDASMHRVRWRCVDAQAPGPFHNDIVSRVSGPFPARVVSVGKNAAWVVLDAESVPRVADLKRAASSAKRAMLAPGDRVDVRLLEDGRALVESVHRRSFTLERRTAGGRSKTMAANVDTLVTVTALADPPPRLTTLDQLLAFAELEGIDALAVFTKPDLAEAGIVEAVPSLYASLGYRTLVVNPKAGINVDGLRAALNERHALLSGVSGVGKSSIFRALGGEAVVGEVSRHGLGRQTTTAARLYRLGGGFLIDSPGVAEFGLGDIGPGELVEGFREMREPARACRFTDCSHLREPGCGVQQAVTEGRIAESRYASYRRILEDR